MAVGLGLLAYASAGAMSARVWQERHAGLFAAGPPPAGTTVGPAVAASTRVPVPARGEALARLRVPRLGIDVVVAEGTDPKTLSLGPGHLLGSALPGESDNCIIAGHRDGPFGRLGGVRPGDLVEVTGSSGLTRYRIDSVTIVGKDDTSPLAPSSTALLTLVTCYPFHYIGAAPKRFIVRAALVDRRA